MVAHRLGRSRFGGWISAADRALSAAQRAGRLLAHLGMLDTCLTRCLVAGALLDSRLRVQVRLGFAPGADPGRPVGHAWLFIAGRRIDTNAADATFETVATISVRKGLEGEVRSAEDSPPTQPGGPKGSPSTGA